MNWNMIQWYCDHQLQRLKIIQCIEKENVDEQVDEEAWRWRISMQTIPSKVLRLFWAQNLADVTNTARTGCSGFSPRLGHCSFFVKPVLLFSAWNINTPTLSFHFNETLDYQGKVNNIFWFS